MRQYTNGFGERWVGMVEVRVLSHANAMDLKKSLRIAEHVRGNPWHARDLEVLLASFLASDLAINANQMMLSTSLE